MSADDPMDEKVDGPAIAAAIMSRLPTAQKERLVKAINRTRPDLATKISDKLFNFDDISDLAPQGIQVLLQNILSADLVLSLKTASPKAKAALLENMSERKQQIVREELAALPQVRLVDVEDAQRRILAKLDELRTSGAIRTQSKKDVWV